MPERYRVIEAHDPEFPEPWTVRKGERLRFERRETESPGWIWSTDNAGEARWVPENWVEIEGDCCAMKRDYNSTELAVDAGEVLTVEFEESGWAWVTKGGRGERLGAVSEPRNGHLRTHDGGKCHSRVTLYHLS